MKPALIVGDGRIPGGLTGLRSLQLGGQQLGNGRKLLPSLRATDSDDQTEDGEDIAHGGRLIELPPPTSLIGRSPAP